jgi:hypothetical protein
MGPLVEFRRLVVAYSELDDLRYFMDPPALRDTTEGKVDVISHHCRCLGCDGIKNSIDKSIDVSINDITSDGNDVASRIAVVDREIGLEIAEFFGSPSVGEVDDLNGRGWWIILFPFSLFTLACLLEDGIDDLGDASEFFRRYLGDTTATGWGIVVAGVDHGEMISYRGRSAVDWEGRKGVDQALDRVLGRMEICL